ncbi:hypothetical protein V5799_021036 [Amblyomma americanum]|uniref:GTP cyclohydrolase 1 feedback regulatory protein n=1 Tax=Amblyomma americanum TaxID=6943 RepID=A0AAQ4FPN4_AMBAM
MPYVMVMKRNNQPGTGPSYLVHPNIDPTLLEYFCARVSQLYSGCYETSDPPCTVLDKLELKGYRVVSQSSDNNCYIWTLHRSP